MKGRRIEDWKLPPDGRHEPRPKTMDGMLWGIWTDGSIWRIKAGADFDCDVLDMRDMLIQQSLELGQPLEIRESQTIIEFRFLPRPPRVVPTS